MPVRGILNPEQCACLDQALQKIAETREIIKACRDCALPMDQAEAELDAQQRLAEGLKRQFFPDRP